MKKPKTLIQKYKEIQKIGTNVEVPWNIWRFMGTPHKNIDTFGDQICIGEDYGSVEEVRNTIEFYVDQLGGKVQWRDND